MQAVVVGAGAAGVYSALLLARYGAEVTLLEAGPAVAPLLRGFTRQGLQFDTGIHHAGTLEPGGILRRYLNFAGIGQRLSLRPCRQDCCELYRFTGEQAEDVLLPQGPAVAGFLAGKWPEQARLIRDFFQEIKTACLRSPFINPRRLSAQALTMSIGSRLSARLDRPEQPLPPRLRSLLGSRSIYYGTPPGRAVFEEYALVAQATQSGVHAIEGGGASLAAAFEAALAEAGVRVLTGSAATAINTITAPKPAVAEVVVNGQGLACDCCVYTGHPSRLPGLLPPGTLRPAMTRHLHTLEETAGAFMLFGCTRSDWLAGRSLVLCATDDIEEAFTAAGLERSWLHLSTGTPSPDGRYPLFAVTRAPSAPPARSSGPDYATWKEGFTNAVKKHIINHVPELADLEVVDSCTEYSLCDWVYGSTGSVYGAMHSIDQTPVLPFTRTEGLRLAGQSVLLPGLLGAFISAAVTCGSLIGYERLFRDLACANAEL